MTTERLATAALLALFALSGCAKSTQPLPNKNTNWLEHCESDDECGEALECRCGVCTVTCERDATCDMDDHRALCWHESSDELADQCDAPLSTDAICVPPELVVADDDPIDEECPTPASCATVIVEGQKPLYGLTADGERIYWFEYATFDPEAGTEAADGALKSARDDGRDIVTLKGELRPRGNLAVDSTHVYFTHAVGDPEVEEATVLSRIPLAGGAVHDLYGGHLSGGLALSDTRVLVHGSLGPGSGGQILSVPNDGSLYTDPALPPKRAEVVARDVNWPDGLIVRDQMLYWNNGSAIARVDLESGDRTALAREGFSTTEGFFSSDLVHHEGHLFWSWSDSVQGGVASIDLSEPEDVRRMEARDPLSSGIAIDAEHVYWTQVATQVASPDGPRTIPRIVRMDRSTEETEELLTLDEPASLTIALSDRYVFVVASAYTDQIIRSYILRFPK
jgi:hypothetical protein